MTGSLHAHFICWAVMEKTESGNLQAQFYFSETATPDSAEFLDRLTRLQAWHRTPEGEYAPLQLRKIESDDGGLLAGALTSGRGNIEAECLYGTFSHGGQTMLLHYYAKSLNSDASDGLRRSRKLDLDVSPRLENGELQLNVFWKGEPAADSQVMVTPPDGKPVELTTEADGTTRLKSPVPGRYEIRARWIVKEAGWFEEKRYAEARHYSAVTFDTSSSVPDDSQATSGAGTTGNPRLTDLPKGITSFGAAVIGDWMYVYGGHFGRAHHYSNTSQSDQLSRLNLRKPGDWEIVAQGPRLQGLAMVAHGGKLYRAGGFTAHNDEGDEHDLRSIVEFVRFDPETGKWESLADLPEPRSSHDAVVIQDKLYVVGGLAARRRKARLARDGLDGGSVQRRDRMDSTPRPALPAARPLTGASGRQALRYRGNATQGRPDDASRRLRSSQRQVVAGGQHDRHPCRRRPGQGDGGLRRLGL